VTSDKEEKEIKHKLVDVITCNIW